uniref:Short-chain dehydrogenase n=1 Tax=Riptortus pedestris TaxID=329032 RepID=R4WDH3_RIPPE|nr:short-chain dehydrogenase [Riptortus pedestris]
MTAWNKKSLCLVSGASQGIGREIAIQFAGKLPSGSTIILTARSENGLNETSSLISKANSSIITKIFPYDMSNPKEKDFTSLLSAFSPNDWEQFILVHNAGTEGTGRPVKDCSNPEEWQKYMSLNLYSMVLLTSAFLKTFKNDEKTIIVNITSLAAVQAIAGFGEYCVGKASREMYMKVLSAESPSLRLLNYSPGPVGTDMVDRCISKIDFSETRGMFEKMKTEGTLVKAPDTVKKLVNIIESGLPAYLRVDYFDRD